MYFDAAHKNGIPADIARSMVVDILEGMSPLLPEPIDADAEMAKIGKHAEGTTAQQKAWIDGHYENGSFSEREVEILSNMSATAEGVKLIGKFMAMSGEKPIPHIPTPDGGVMSSEDWQIAYRAAVRDKNYKRQAELDKMAEENPGLARSDLIPEFDAPEPAKRAGGRR